MHVDTHPPPQPILLLVPFGTASAARTKAKQDQGWEDPLSPWYFPYRSFSIAVSAAVILQRGELWSSAVSLTPAVREHLHST